MVGRLDGDMGTAPTIRAIALWNYAVGTTHGDAGTMATHRPTSHSSDSTEDQPQNVPVVQSMVAISPAEAMDCIAVHIASGLTITVIRPS